MLKKPLRTTTRIANVTHGHAPTILMRTPRAARSRSLRRLTLKQGALTAYPTAVGTMTTLSVQRTRRFIPVRWAMENKLWASIILVWMAERWLHLWGNTPLEIHLSSAHCLGNNTQMFNSLYYYSLLIKLFFSCFLLTTLVTKITVQICSKYLKFVNYWIFIFFDEYKNLYFSLQPPKSRPT